MIEKAYDRKFWLFHVNTCAMHSKSQSNYYTHFVISMIGSCYGIGKNVKVRVNHLKVLILKAKYNPCNIK